MASFGSSGRFGCGDGDQKETIVGKIEDIKVAPRGGESRVIVREKSGRRSTMAVDMPVEHSSRLERKETYKFQVEEKADTRGGSSTRMRSSSFRTYHCDDTPEKYNGSSWTPTFGNYGGDDDSNNRRSRKFMS